MRAGEKLNILTHARLCELLEYNRDTGLFVWRVSRRSYGGKIKVGVVAGQIDSYGHRNIGIDGYRYMAHRLAWFYCHKEWPLNEIDHANTCRDDNRLDNLRVVPYRSYQRANQHVRRDSLSGLKGIQLRSGGRWIARITKNGKTFRLGRFDTPELAHAAYVRAAERLFGEFARAG